MKLSLICESVAAAREFRLHFDKGGYWFNLREELERHGYREGVDYVIDDGRQTLKVTPNVQFTGSLRHFMEHVGRAERADIPKPDIFS